MPINAAKHIWYNGKLVPWEKATVHVLAHALHYGSTVFEGERAYATPNGPVIFRLKDHTRRLFDSAKIYSIEIPLHARSDQRGVQRDHQRQRPHQGRVPAAVRVSQLRRDRRCAEDFAAHRYGGRGLRMGLVSRCRKVWRTASMSWCRRGSVLAPNTIPALGKAAGNYLSSQLISMEAKRLGFAEGIGLGVDGTVSEGAGENLFVIRDGVIYTPGLANSILQGITRDTVVTLARAHGFEVREQSLPREFLYLADEIFMTGTAAEITPVRSVDKITVGAGKRGPITEAIQTAFFGLFTRQDRGQMGLAGTVRRRHEAGSRRLSV